MDRLGPTGKVSKKKVHLSRWTSFLDWTGPIEMDRPLVWLVKWCKIHKVCIHSHSMPLLLFTSIFIHIQQPSLRCVAGVQTGGKGERRAREAREDRTREDRGRDRVPSSSRAHFDLPPFLRPATQAAYHLKCFIVTPCS